MTVSHDPASYPAQFAEIVSTVYSTGQRARVVCPSPSDAARLRRLFYGWRKALRLQLQSKALEDGEREQLKRSFTCARRVLIQATKDSPNVLYFVFRDEADDAKLLDSVEYE